jgi:hypothetical protein
MRNEYKILIRKSQLKSTFGRPRHRGQIYINFDVGEIGYEVANWIRFRK